RRYGSTFCDMSPGRKPSRSPASTAGRTSTTRRTASAVSASTAAATAIYVLPVPAGPMPNVRSRSRIARAYSAWCAPRARTSRRRVWITDASGSPRPPGRACSTSDRCTRSGSSVSRSVAAKRSSRTARAFSTASAPPAISKRLPRFLMRTSSRCSMSRRCSSSWPVRFASRRWSSGTSSSSTRCAVVDASGNGLQHRPRVESSSQGVRQRLGNAHVDELADESRIACEVDPAVVLGAARDLARGLLRRPLDEHALHRAYHAAADRGRLRIDERLQALETRLRDLSRHEIAHRRGWRAGPRAVDEAERLIEADRANQIQRCLEVLVGLAGEADDEVRRDRDPGPHLLQPFDLAQVLRRRVTALHRGEDSIR